MQKLKDKCGITLIALIITIIVLLILVGVTVALSIGNNGLIDKAQGAAFIQEMVEIDEQIQQKILERKIDNLGSDFKLNVGLEDQESIRTILPNIKEKYENEIVVQENITYYYYIGTDLSRQRAKWCFEYNFPVWGFNSYEEFLEGTQVVEVSKGEYTEIDGLYCCSPDLTGFNVKNTYYITYDSTGKAIIGNKINKGEPENWYNYKEKEWANIVTISEESISYFVWIPRYVYKITDATNKEVDVKFVDKYNNYTDSNGTTNYTNSEEYVLPEAFTWDGTPVSGYWVSKYELSDTSTGIAIDTQIKENSLKVISATSTSMTSSVASYDFYLNGELKQENGSIPYEYTDLIANTTYEVMVLARDSSGNITGALVQNLKTLEKSIEELTKPDLTGFNASNTYYVTYDSDGKAIIGNKIDREAPENWYNYENKEWANIVTISDDSMSYFVWIPRYEYKIMNRVGNGKRVNIRFISKTQGNADSGYQIPESFIWDEIPISGYWVSKYELSDTSTGIAIDTQIKENSLKIVSATKTSMSSTVASYDFYLNGELKQENGTVPYEYTNLTANTTYEVMVLARDSSGNIIGALVQDLKTLEKSIEELTKPDMTGFNQANTYYVTYDSEGNEESSTLISEEAPENWYNYENKEWANVVTKNGDKLAYFVWIPRYEYKIMNKVGDGKRINIRFISKTQGNPDSGYQIPESFKWDGAPISGYWVSKYELSQ